MSMYIISTNATSFNELDRLAISRIRAVLKAAPSKLGLGHLHILLAVAAEEGLSVNDLAEQIDVPQQTASRHIATLLGRYQDPLDENPSPPLLEQRISREDPRKRAIFLTPDGHQIVADLISAGGNLI